jgi:hypothetical protein
MLVKSFLGVFCLANVPDYTIGIYQPIYNNFRRPAYLSLYEGVSSRLGDRRDAGIGRFC